LDHKNNPGAQRFSLLLADHQLVRTVRLADGNVDTPFEAGSQPLGYFESRALRGYHSELCHALGWEIGDAPRKHRRVTLEVFKRVRGL